MITFIRKISYEEICFENDKNTYIRFGNLDWAIITDNVTSPLTDIARISELENQYIEFESQGG